MLNLETLDISDYNLFAVHLINLLEEIDKIEPYTLVPQELISAISERGLGVISPLINTISKREYFGRTRLSWIPLAISQIGQIAISILFNMLKDNSATTRACSAWAIGVIGEKAAIGLLLDTFRNDIDCDVQAKIAWTLAYLAPIGNSIIVDLLIQSVETGCASVRPQAAYALGSMHDKRAIGSLFSVLEDKDSNLRLQSLYALTRLLNKREAFQLLLHFIKAEDEQMRVFALHYLISLIRTGQTLVSTTLDEMGILEYISILSKALASINREIRYIASISLGRIGNEQVIEPLARALFDEYNEVRRIAVEGLFRIGDARSIVVLEKAKVFDVSTIIRKRALEAIVNIEQKRISENKIE